MRSIKHILYLFALILVLGSCEEQLKLETKSSFDEPLVFSNYTLVEENIFGIYNTFGQTNAHRARYSSWYGLNTDIEFYHSSGDPDAGQVANSKQELTGYVVSVNNSQLNTSNGAYAQLFNGIEKANVIIKGLLTYGNIESQPDMAYLYGEALTLRAILYFDLLRAWSDVPARFEPITSETIYIPKNSRDTIYKRLISDLQIASDLVPWPNEMPQTATVERVNKTTVKAYLARLCMVASGYSQYPVTLNSGAGTSEIRLSNDPQLAKSVLYPIALKACQDIMESETCKLEPDFINIWKDNMSDVVTAGRESIFEIPYSDTRGRWMYTWAIPHGGQAPGETVDKYTAKSCGGAGGPVPNLFYDYDIEDARRDVTCVPYRYTDGIQEVSGVNRWFFGKYRFEWMARFAENTTDHGINPIYMRYADVILMAAECANELDDLDKAKTYFRLVRERAFPNNSGKVDTYMSRITDKTSMFDAIVDERAFEFCGEFVRKQDLIRWNLLSTKMNEAKTKMTELSNLSSNYANINSQLYYKLNDDGETLSFYGLNRGELDDPGEEWTSIEYISPGQLKPEKINGLFWQNPDDQQFWPIFQVFIDASAGALVNDYIYN